MARPKSIPKASRHTSGQAVVRLDGKDHYLGKHGSQEAEAEYNRLIASWLGNSRQLAAPAAQPITINEVALAYLKHAERAYVNGRRSSHFACILSAVRVCRSVCGRTSAAEFGPKMLKSVRQQMIRKGWSRNYVNIQTQRIRAMFRWAAEEEMIAGTVYHGLLSVRGVRCGTPDVRETEPVRPVSLSAVEAILDLVLPPVAAMIRLQLLTGARPGEITMMRMCDLDMTEKVWVFRPDRYKTKHLGHTREVYLGPRAQAVIRPWLRTDPASYLFCPAEARIARYRERQRNRKTPLWPSHQNKKHRQHPRRAPRAHYDVHSYRRAIYRACDTAFPPPPHLAKRENETLRQWIARMTPEEKQELARWRSEHRWHPHQLRHNAATNLRNEFGIEAARVILGHSSAFTTQIYVQLDRQRAIEVMGKVG
jgi:integrase